MLTCQKHLFSIPEDITYLNCAYMSPQMKSVDEVGIKSVVRKNSPWETTIPDFFKDANEVKVRYASILNVSDPQRVAIVPSASYGLANVARNLPFQTGQNIVLAAEQFPSNFYIWQRLVEEKNGSLKTVSAAPSSNRSQALTQAVLDGIDENTAVVTLGHVHWADGTLYDLEAIGQKARSVGSALVIDGTQSIGALPFDVAKFQPDAVVCGGYKWLMGPYSLGAAYYGPLFDQGTPIEENWINRLHSEDFRNLVNYQPAYQPGAGRYSMGEQSQFVLAPMFAEAMRQLLEWGIDNIQAYCAKISRDTIAALQDLGCQVDPFESRANHLIGVRLGENIDATVLQQQFNEKRVLVSVRGNAIRVAPNVYNDEGDFEVLLACFKAAAKAKTMLPVQF
jgi:selenocysteine lyase/cysteine desulfurase